MFQSIFNLDMTGPPNDCFKSSAGYLKKGSICEKLMFYHIV